MRPIFLVVDPPDPEALSTRKLVLESAKFNVLTAFAMPEAEEIMDYVPLHAAIVHERACVDQDPAQMVAKLKAKHPETPIIVLAPNPGGIPQADYVLSSHDPIELVRLLQKMFKIPEDPTALEPEPSRRQKPGKRS